MSAPAPAFPACRSPSSIPSGASALIEATGKKARFVEHTAQRLGLRNVEVVQRARRAITGRSSPSTRCFARALSSLADFVAYAGHLCAPDGRLLAMKGKRPDEEICGAAEILPRAGGASDQAAGAGRRAAYCGTLPGGTGIAGQAKAEHHMKRVIAVANQKGGVGKTTTAVNLAASLTATKRRVLLIDLDPQGNATMGCGIDKNSQTHTSCDVLLGDCAAAEALVRGRVRRLSCSCRANQDLTAAEVRLLTMMAGREFKLRNALKPMREDFDVILIDCPPSLNMLTLNALVAADSVMVPMQCEYYALEGLSALVQTIEQIRGSINPELEIEGLLRTMFDPRNNLANEVSAQLIEHFGDKVFRTLIPRNIRLAEAPSFGKPALFHDKESRGALAYLALAGEMIRRDELPPAPV